jgi:hypothetical protein
MPIISPAAIARRSDGGLRRSRIELLYEYLRRIEQHRRGRERGTPVRQPVAPGERVHHGGDAEANEVLQGGHKRQGVKRPQQPQENGVAARVHHVRG